jgi:hypothetical protein
VGATALVAARAAAAPSVWVIDDGEKVKADATDTSFERGQDDPVWKAGDAVRLFAMRNESVALQVVVEADPIITAGISRVTVDLDALDGTGDAEGARLVNPPRHKIRPVGAPIERFVEHFVSVRRPSAIAGDGAASEGWESGAGPDAKAWVGLVPDALIPVDTAPSWWPYPMHIAPGDNGIVWIDLNVPRDQRPGVYRGAIRVQAEGVSIADIPVELEVVDALLPDRTVAATAGYDARELGAKLGPAGEEQLWQLLHAHRIAPLHDAVSVGDLTQQREALDGSLYTPGRHYVGPAPGLGDGVLALGSGGAFGSPDERSLATIEAIADGVSADHLFGGSDVFLDVSNETCSSAWATGWQKLLREAPDPNAQRIRLGWRCTQDPSRQAVDLPVLHAAWDPARTRTARTLGKTPWVYGGALPRTGTFLLDAEAISPRVNGWLAAMEEIPRWIVPQVAAWTDDRNDEPVDPFADPETPADGTSGWSNGGGVLVYPGSEYGDGGHREHAVDVAGVLPSIRLKNWRRGIEDAGYLQLARDKDPAGADAIARWLIPAAFSAAESGRPASWSPRGKAFFEARRALLAIILGRAPVALETSPATPAASAGAPSAGCSLGAGGAAGGLAMSFLAGATLIRRNRRRTRVSAVVADRGC